MSLFVARIKGFVRFKDLMGQLVSRDLKLKYRRSVLGYLWSVLNPLFIMIIMAIVFSKMFTRASITNFPVYLMSGQVMFNFMNLSTKSAIQSINGSASLVLAQNFVFTMGLGLFLAATNVFFRDIQYIYNAITTAWLYLTPMFYPIEALPQNLQYIVSHLNPMYSYVSQFRMLTLPGFVPVGISIMWLIIIGIVSAFLMLIIGLWVFVKTQDKFILYI